MRHACISIYWVYGLEVYGDDAKLKANATGRDAFLAVVAGRKPPAAWLASNAHALRSSGFGA